MGRMSSKEEMERGREKVDGEMERGEEEREKVQMERRS